MGYRNCLLVTLLIVVVGFVSPVSTQAQNNVQIRFINTAPNAGSIDVYFNGNITFQNTVFSQASNYLPVNDGTLTVGIRRTGEDPNAPPLIGNVPIPLAPNRSYSIVLVGEQQLELLTFEDDINPTAPNTARVRYIHAIPNAPDVDVCIVSQDCNVRNLAYRASQTVDVQFGTYILDFRVPSNNNAVLTSRQQTFDDGFFYTCIVLGSISGQPAPQLDCIPQRTRDGANPDPAPTKPPAPGQPPDTGAILAPEVALGLGVTFLILVIGLRTGWRYLRK